MGRKKENMTPEELDRYHTRLFWKCVRRYKEYSDRCARLERHFEMARFSYKNRVPFWEMGTRMEQYSIEQLEEFWKELKPSYNEVSEFAYRRPFEHRVPVEEIQERIVDMWYSFKSKVGRAKNAVVDSFIKLLSMKTTSE